MQRCTRPRDRRIAEVLSRLWQQHSLVWLVPSGHFHWNTVSELRALIAQEVQNKTKRMSIAVDKVCTIWSLLQWPRLLIRHSFGNLCIATLHWRIPKQQGLKHIPQLRSLSTYRRSAFLTYYFNITVGHTPQQSFTPALALRSLRALAP